MSSGVLADLTVLGFVCRLRSVGQAACEVEGGAALAPFFDGLWTDSCWSLSLAEFTREATQATVSSLFSLVSSLHI